ncbi:MAG: peptidoglycan-binding protein [Alphaproteobacteria bacterium]
MSNAPVANGSANPIVSNGTPNASFTPGRSDSSPGSSPNVALSPGSSNPSVSTASPLASSLSPPPHGTEGSARLDLPSRSDTGSRPPPTLTTATTAPSGGIERPASGVFDLPVLQLGSSDRAVGLLQRALSLLGFLQAYSEKVFGAATDQAVRTFQGALGLAKDGVVGNRETWPALNKALVTRHEGMARLADALMPGRSLAPPQAAEMRQLTGLLGEFSERALPSATGKEMAFAAGSARDYSPSTAALPGEAQAGRPSPMLADAARALGLPVSALIASNAELSRSYLVLQSQLTAMPNPVKEKRFRREPKQLHPADPDGHLANAHMHPDFVALVNGMIAQLRGEGHDVRVIAGYRSFAQQQARYEQGRSASGKIVTDRPAGHSWHNYGLAVDIVLNDDDGKPAWPEASSPFWQRLADVALARGAVWGGRFGYPAHVEYHPKLGHGDAATLIEDFESYGLDAVWERVLPEPEPEEEA